MERIIYNPIFKDQVTFLQTSVETNGKYSELEVILAAKGGNPLHKHTAFSETFTVVEGILGVSVNGVEHLIEPGQSVTAQIGDVHRFCNPTERDVKFNLVFRPGHSGAENMLRILYGLARDGKTNKSGIPTSFTQIAVVGEIGDTGLVGIMSLLAPILRFVAKLGRRKGVDRQLLDQYCKPKATAKKAATVL